YRWDMPVTSSPVSIDVDDTWAVRLEIPLAVLRRRVLEDAPATDLSLDIGFQLAAAGVSSTGESIAVSWETTDTSYHSPMDFGHMRLGGPISQFGMSVDSSIGDGSDEMLRMEFEVESESTNMGPAHLEVFLRP